MTGAGAGGHRRRPTKGAAIAGSAGAEQPRSRLPPSSRDRGPDPRPLPAAIYRASPGRPPLACPAPAAPPAAPRYPPPASGVLRCSARPARAPHRRRNPPPAALPGPLPPPPSAPPLKMAAAIGNEAPHRLPLPRPRARAGPDPAPAGPRAPAGGTLRPPSPPGGPRRRSSGPLALSAHREPLADPWPCPGSRSRRAGSASRSVPRRPAGPQLRSAHGQRSVWAARLSRYPRRAPPHTRLGGSRARATRGGESEGMVKGSDCACAAGERAFRLCLSPPPLLRGRPGACALLPWSRGRRRSFWRQAGARAVRSGARACPGVPSRRRPRLVPALMAAAAAGRALERPYGRALELVSRSAFPSPSAQLWEAVRMRKASPVGARHGCCPHLLSRAAEPGRIPPPSVRDTPGRALWGKGALRRCGCKGG